MIYYPLSVLMLAGIRDILVITRPEDESILLSLVKRRRAVGVNISYATQPNPGGVAEGLLIGERFLDGSDCVYILGDNIFWGWIIRLFENGTCKQFGRNLFYVWSGTPNDMALSNLMMHAK